MKKEDLFESIGSIDDNLVQKSEEKTHKNWYKKTYGVVIAACLCICILGAAFMYPNIINQSPNVDKNIDDTEKINDYAKQKGLQNNVTEDTENPEFEGKVQERIQELQNGDTIGWIVIDNSIYMQSQYKELDVKQNYQYLGQASDFIGYYQNEDSVNGKVYLLSDEMNEVLIELDNGGIVFLTKEDTMTISNDVLIDESTEEGTTTLNKDAPIDESTYREASDYPADITELQQSISDAMSNGELPFVISSAIMENPLRLKVTVLTEDEESLNKVLKYDPSGKYIDFVYSENGQILE